MSEALTAKRFEEFVDAYTQNHSEAITHLQKIDDRLDKIDGRLDNIEKLLWPRRASS